MQQLGSLAWLAGLDVFRLKLKVFEENWGSWELVSLAWLAWLLGLDGILQK